MPADPLEQRLAALGSEPAAPLPPAADVRARGDARTRRGRALLAGAGAVLTALAVTAALAVPGGATDEPDVLDVATAAPTPVEDPVRAALLDPPDLVRALGGGWQERATEDLPFPVLPTACEDGRAFAISAPSQGDTGTAVRHLDGPDGAVVGHAVLSFGDADRAAAAEARLFEALRSCSPDGSFLGDTPGRSSVPGERPLVVLREGAVLTAVRHAAGTGPADSAVLAPLGDAALEELRASGLLGTEATAAPTAPPTTAPPSASPVDPGVSAERLLDADDVEEVTAGDWTAGDPVEDAFLLLSPCPAAQGAPGGLRRGLDATGGGSVQSQVLGYAHASGAEAALDRLFEDLQRCPSREQDSGDGTVEHVLLAGEDDTLLEVRRTQRGPSGSSVDGAVVQAVGDALVLVLTDRVEDLPALADAARARAATDGSRPGTGLAQVREALLDPEDAAAVEPGDWQEQEVTEARLIDPCEGGTAYPQDSAVTEQVARALAVRREAGGTGVGQEVWRYESPAAAREAVAGYDRAVQGCPREPGRGEGVTTVHEVVQRFGDAGLLIRVTGECPSCVPYPTYLAALTSGDVVLVLSVGVGEDGDPGTGLVQSYLDAALAELESARR